MEDRTKKLEMEVCYLKREIDSLKIMLLNGNGNTNNITYNINQPPVFMDSDDDKDNFLKGINLN